MIQHTKYKHRLLWLLILLLMPFGSFAEEGMWLPLLLKNEKYAQMRKMGLKLSPEEIYAVNQACLSNAVIGLLSEGSNLRSFCTASFISDQGLILTNYHCIIQYIERFSNAENDFIKYGYWATKREEESFCRGLEMKQLVRMVDVTQEILTGTEGLEGADLQRKIDENGVAIAKRETAGTRYQARTTVLFGGAQYILNIYSVYKDIRMVAAPPFAISKFGGDTDNYSWPRHTGDFAILRVYADENNQPRFYSDKNRPYRPLTSLSVSLQGYREGDFAMAFGFPGTTREYIPSFALEKIIYRDKAASLAFSREKKNLIREAIEYEPNLRFRYTTRLSSVNNNYLRTKGEIEGVSEMGLVEKKRKEEEAFQRWTESTPEYRKEYGTILQEMKTLYEKLSVYNQANLYFTEAALNGTELVPFIGKFEKLVAIYNRKNPDLKEAEKECRRLEGLTNQFFEDWGYELDRKIFRQSFYRYYTDVPEQFKDPVMHELVKQYNGDVEELTATLFKNSIFTKKEALLAFLADTTRNIGQLVKQDELYRLAISYYKINVTKIAGPLKQLQAEQSEQLRKYYKALLLFNKGRILYPDANASLRLSYGKIEGAQPQDGLRYDYFTTLEGVQEKALRNPDETEFYMPKKLSGLLKEGNYGKYANRDGKLPVNFLVSLHTTSGNSGSPVLNGKGELIGLNFDRIWQGTASDYGYVPQKSRAIAVDIRYILFVLERYSPSKYVLQELKIGR